MDAHIAAGTGVPCASVEATDPLYILYTSGTTGQPKGVVRDNGGHMVALNWSMSNLYDIAPGEVFWAASDVGWVVGHSYIVYAPLVHGATTIVFEGKPVGTPDAGTFWRVIEEHKVASLFTAPTAFRAIKKEDPNGEFIGKYDLSSLRSLFLAGERADPDTIVWAQDKLGVPVIDHWWQTETGWAIAGNPLGLGQLPVKIGSPTVAMPGYDVQIIDDAGHPVPPERSATSSSSCRCRHPACRRCGMPISVFARPISTSSRATTRRRTPGYMDEDGYLFIMARTDDIINVAGHRLSTGGMEEVIASHPDVAECAVIGIADALKGQMPAGFLILNSGVDRSEQEIEKEVVALVREKIGPGRGLQDGDHGRNGCPRPVPARSFGAPCRRSPTARIGRCRRPSTIRRSWMRSARNSKTARSGPLAADPNPKGRALARPFGVRNHQSVFEVGEPQFADILADFLEGGDQFVAVGSHDRRLGR
jgi:propionyl-CoA synthetase